MAELVCNWQGFSEKVVEVAADERAENVLVVEEEEVADQVA